MCRVNKGGFSTPLTGLIEKKKKKKKSMLNVEIRGGKNPRKTTDRAHIP